MTARAPLCNQTNVQQTQLSAFFPRPNGKRPSSPVKKPAKRVKLSTSPAKSTTSSKSPTSENDSESDPESFRPRRFTRRMSSAIVSHHNTFPSSTVPYLRGFVSSVHTDILKCQSITPGYFLTIPYACAYANSAKSGSNQLLAVATEEGTLNLHNISKRMPWEPETIPTSTTPHASAIFTVKWSSDDSRIATGTGDQKIGVIESRSMRRTLLLSGHKATVRSLSWDPHHDQLLSSGSRDGQILLWDLRTPDMPIGKIGKGRSSSTSVGDATRSGFSTPALPSITSLVHLEGEPFTLISSTSKNGIVKAWDTRFCNKSAPHAIHESDSDPSLQGKNTRPRGIVSLSKGSGPSTGNLFALSSNSKIYTYSTPFLSPLKSTYSHPNLKGDSFYLTIATSPCGRWLASSGKGETVDTFLWDVSDAGRPLRKAGPGVQLKGQRGAAGSIDWSDESLAACGEDGTVRIWRNDEEAYSKCLESESTRKFDYLCSV